MRLPDTQPVFSRGERVVLWTVSVLLCLVSVLSAMRFTVSRAEQDFMQQAALVYEDISQRLSGLEAVLVSLAGLHHASDALSQTQFSAFAQELLGAYPWLDAIVFVTKTVAGRGRNVPPVHERCGVCRL